MVPDPSPLWSTAGFQSFLHSAFICGHWQIPALLVDRNLGHRQNNQEPEAKPQCSQPSLLSKQKHPSFHQQYPCFSWHISHEGCTSHSLTLTSHNHPFTPCTELSLDPTPEEATAGSALCLLQSCGSHQCHKGSPTTLHRKKTALTKSRALDKTPW